MADKESRIVRENRVVGKMALKHIVEFHTGIGYVPEDHSQQVFALQLVSKSGLNFNFSFSLEDAKILAQAITETINDERN